MSKNENPEIERRLQPHERIVEIMTAITQDGPLPYSELLARMEGLKTTAHVRRLVSIAEDRRVLQGLTGDGDLPEGLTEGKPNATQYVEICRPGGCVVGVNVGRKYFAVGVADPNGRLLSVNGEPPSKELQGKAKEVAWVNHRAGQIAVYERKAGVDGRVLLKEAAKRADEWIDELRLDRREIRGITLSLPVPVSTTEARTLTHSIEPSLANVASLEVTFKDLLGKRRYPRLEKVIVANDADVAARGEIRYGNAYGKNDVIAIHAAYGIGAGIISQGRVLRSGAGGGLGEIGHCVPSMRRDEGVKHGLVALDPGEELFRCDCDCLGHLEAMAGGVAIVRRIAASRENLDDDPPPPLLDGLLEDPEVNMAQALDGVLQAATDSDPWRPGLEAVLDAAHMLGGALHTVAHLLRPEVIYLCGKLSEAGEPFLKMVAEGLRAPGSLENYEPTLELGKARNEFGRRLIMVRGAAMTAVRGTKPLITREDLEQIEIDEDWQAGI